MAQSTEQGLFSTGNASGTRERVVNPLTHNGFNSAVDFGHIDGTLATLGAVATTHTLTKDDVGRILRLDLTGQTAVQTLVVPHPRTCSGQTIEIIQITDSASGGNLVIDVDVYEMEGFLFNIAGATVTSDSIINGTDTEFTVTLPLAGSQCKFVSDGNTWFLSGTMIATSSASAA